jgi:hypothetical protein
MRLPKQIATEIESLDFSADREPVTRVAQQGTTGMSSTNKQSGLT